jgi:ribosomal protein S18 acetylase RimI-like enzyme
MIRRYRESDREILKQITADTFENVSIDRNIERKFGLIAGHGWKERKVRHIDADCDANPEGVFVYEEDGRVIGFLTSRIDAFTKIGWIPNMAVAEGHQGKGIGKQLLQECLAYFREHGMVMAKIETLDQNEIGLHLYPKLGFVEVATQIHYVMPL